MIIAHDVGRLYGRGDAAVGLHGLSFEAGPGRVVAVLGHNGAGKTTLVRGLATLQRFDRGRAEVAGFDVATQARQVRERIAVVGQGVAVDEHLTARQNLVLFGRLRGLASRVARERAGELVDRFGLGDAADRVVSGFSGGMRRRLDVAASMIVRHAVLFVDEPTTGLDPAARRDLWRILSDLRAGGSTVLLTTQYLEEADALADHILLLAHGRLIAEGSSDDLKGLLGNPEIRLRFTTPEEQEVALPVLAALDPGAVRSEATEVLLHAADDDTLARCLRELADHGLFPVEAVLRKPALDDVFLALTQNPTKKGART